MLQSAEYGKGRPGVREVHVSQNERISNIQGGLCRNSAQGYLQHQLKESERECKANAVYKSINPSRNEKHQEIITKSNELTNQSYSFIQSQVGNIETCYNGDTAKLAYRQLR